MLKKISKLMLIVCLLFTLAGCEKHEHSYEDKVIEPTCTEQGYTEHTCSCGDTFKDTYTEVIEHKYGEWEIVKEATEDEEGLKEKECSVCGNKVSEKIEKLAHEHVYENVVTEPTCTEQGYTTCVCECGDSYIDSYEDALGHSYGEWEIVKEATYTEEGIKQKECSECGDIVEEKIEKLAHEHAYGEWVVIKEATTTEEGTKQKECSICGNVVTMVIPLVQELFTSLDGKVVSFLGDSITTFYAPDSAVNSYYSGENQFYYPRYSASVKKVEQTWWYQLYNNTSMKLGINNSWSGSCAYGTSSSAGQTDGRINTLDDNGMPDIVIVYLGTNDCAGGFALEDYSSAIKTIINKINALGKTQIYLTTLGYSAYEFNSSSTKYRDANRLLYNAELRSIAEEYGCGIIPLDEYVVDDNYGIYLGDNLHYNAKGATLLSLIAEKAIKEYNGITFDKEIVVEHNEKLPEGVLGYLTASSNGNFWVDYQEHICIYESAKAPIALYSLRIELTKQNDKYYVSGIFKSGQTRAAHKGDYTIIISDSYKDAYDVKSSLNKLAEGCIAEFDQLNALPYKITFKVADGNYVPAPEEEKPEVIYIPETPEGALFALNATATTGFWTSYAENVYLYKSSDNLSPQFSLRIEIKKAADGTYYVSKVHQNGETATLDSDYVIIVSESFVKYSDVINAGFDKVPVGTIVEFDQLNTPPIKITFYPAE